MAKVRLTVANQPNKTLHEGHKALINYGKQIGDVVVTIVEDNLARNRYLFTGQGTSKYQVDYTSLRESCETLQVQHTLFPYVLVPEETRLKAYEEASTLVNMFQDVLLEPRYTQFLLSSVMLSILGVKDDADVVLYGPEVQFFAWKKLSAILWRSKEILIYPHNFVKDQAGLKVGTRELPNHVDTTKWRSVINVARDKYKVGRNQELVAELNASYPASLGWRIHSILVYEGGFVDGRLEVTSFSVRTKAGLEIIDEVDYFPN